MRAQTNLFALVVALGLLTGATVVGVGAADAALAGATSDPRDRHTATVAADRLVAADSPTTVRANALDATAIEDLNASRVETLVPAVKDAKIRISLDGDPVVERGSPATGVTVRRSVVVVSSTPPIRETVDVARESTLQVPQGVDRATVAVHHGPNATIRSVRANDRVVLHDNDSLDGNATVRLSRYASTRIGVDASENATGRVVVTYRRPLTETRTLTVTADV